MVSKEELKRLNKLAKKAIEEDRGVVVIPEKVEFIKIPEKATIVKPHYRKINGKRVYVKAHYRKKPKHAKKTKP